MGGGPHIATGINLSFRRFFIDPMLGTGWRRGFSADQKCRFADARILSTTTEFIGVALTQAGEVHGVKNCNQRIRACTINFTRK